VRLQVVRRLHERHGFDVLAFEGSAIGSWLAQEELYRTDEPADDAARRAQQLAWFGLWQTEPMLDVMRYVASTLATPKPLYLASFDIQPGISRAFDGSGAKALAALFDGVATYQAPESPEQLLRWREAIAPLLRTSRSETRTAEARQAAEQALTEVEAWLARVIPAVAQRRGEQHAQALQQIPASLRATIELSWRVQGANIRTYQETRDELNAQRAIELRDGVSRSHEVMLWAHHSHINYNVTGAAPRSMGQRLHERLGDQMYSIGVFAAEGQAVEIRENSAIPIIPRSLPPLRDFGVESRLAAVRDGSFFVDLTSLRHNTTFASWLEPLSARYEVPARTQIALARDFDAAILVREVHATRLLMVPTYLDRSLRIYGWGLDHLWGVVTAGLGVVGVVARRWWRRRQTRAEAASRQPEARSRGQSQ